MVFFQSILGMKVGIAISLYDKFKELSILIDIIKNNWKGDYIISVCSNHKNPEPHIKDLDIDVFTKGEDIHFVKDLEWMRKSINFRSRISDCIKKSCNGAINAGADFVMHLHTDAWPLKEEEVLKVIEEMKKKKKTLAIRGMGFGKYRHDCPTGHIDDMFWIMESKALKKTKFLDFNTIAMLPHKLSIHGLLSLLMVTRVGLENIYHYDNHIGHVHWDGKPHPIDLERGRPSMFDPKRAMVHVDVNAFPKELGKSVQAMYLVDHNLTKGKNIQAFLKKHFMNKKRLLKRLDKEEKRLNSKLKWQGFPILKMGRFGRTFGKKIKYLNKSPKSKFTYWLGANGRYIWDKTVRERLGLDLVPDYSFWPTSMDTFLGTFVHEKDYPNGNDSWFKEVKVSNKNKRRTYPNFYFGFRKFW
jgi:hypothetical protein